MKRINKSAVLLAQRGYMLPSLASWIELSTKDAETQIERRISTSRGVTPAPPRPEIAGASQRETVFQRHEQKFIKPGENAQAISSNELEKRFGRTIAPRA
jgi:hypothetical protein